MKVAIVACGDSAKDWHTVPVDLSIGVNDCAKFGKDPDYLVVVNSPSKFNEKRFKTIIDTKPKRFFCHNSNWKPYFPKYESLAMKVFIGNYRKGRIYSSKTSPFVAISLAASLGATEIILWGVDMITHHRYSPGKKEFDIELSYYRLLCEGLKENGVNVSIGNENTILKQFLPVHKSITSNSIAMDK